MYYKILHFVNDRSEIDRLDLFGLQEALEKKFGCRSLEFKVRKRMVPNGVADIVARTRPGHSIMVSTMELIESYAAKWIEKHSA